MDKTRNLVWGIWAVMNELTFGMGLCQSTTWWVVPNSGITKVARDNGGSRMLIKIGGKWWLRMLKRMPPNWAHSEASHRAKVSRKESVFKGSEAKGREANLVLERLLTLLTVRQTAWRWEPEEEENWFLRKARRESQWRFVLIKATGWSLHCN